MRVEKSTNMHGFDKYLDLVFDGFDLYIVTLVKTESELILRIYVLTVSTSRIFYSMIGQNYSQLTPSWLDFHCFQKETELRKL